MPATTSHTLASLLEGLKFKVVKVHLGGSIEEQMIGSISADSRTADGQSLFVALPGTLSDGHDFIESAVAAGCRAVVCGPGKLDKVRTGNLGATVIEVEDTGKAYAIIAANYFSWPANNLRFVGITGTNGKTTISYLVEQVLLQTGLTVGVIGTVNNRYTGRDGRKKVLPTRFTTPEAFLLQQVIREMADNGVELVIMEVSSHALDQARIGTLLFDVAAFTNLSHDHLDYHGNMEDYFRAKTLLFSDYLKGTATAVLPLLPAGEENGKRLGLLQDICRKSCAETLLWGDEEGADIRLLNSLSTLAGTDMVVKTPTGSHSLRSFLVGRYNIDNLLTTYGICMALGLEEKRICKALAGAKGAPGRLERVSTGPHWQAGGPVVLVDYAHTPDALQKVLETVADLPHQQLFCVFGCGGDRDRYKRPLMGEIAGNICDVAVVTDDNPRTEDPEQIVAQIVDGLDRTPLAAENADWLAARNSKNNGFVVIRDRKMAIRAAIYAASSEDIVVIAGKGHEPYQLTREGKRFFDDRLEARGVLFSWTTELVAAAVKGRLHAGNYQSGLLGPVITDSRVVSSKGIFVALKGENHDAHDFVRQAVENGAACLVVERKMALPAELEVDQVEVADTEQALGDLAAFRRRALAGQCQQLVIGLTGSCGKTTVKEMVAAILERVWPEGPDYPAGCVLKTRGNFNNLIGLPLSLLPLDVCHRAAVLEMGMNRPGELSRLGAIAAPDISCITNIHGAHLEGLQSIEGVARAKEELFAATGETGTLIINLDDPRIRDLAGKYNNPQITFSMQKEQGGQLADVWASRVRLEDRDIVFTLHHGLQSIDVQLHTAGEHNVLNALCAAAIGVAAGATLEQIAAGLGDFRPQDKRMQMLLAKSGFTIINDTYNANPASMTAGLKTLKTIPGKTTVAIIGDMLELGAESARAHRAIGRLLAELAIDYAGVVGEFKKDVVEGALEQGFGRERIHPFEEKESAAAWLKTMIDGKRFGRGDVVLVKASRGLRFETIVAEITDF